MNLYENGRGAVFVAEVNRWRHRLGTMGDADVQGKLDILDLNGDGMHAQLMFECEIATHKAIEENTCQISCQCDVTNTLAQESTNQ